MATNIDRIRERTRRINAKQAKRQGAPTQGARRARATELAPLGLDAAQGTAIRKALAHASANEATVHHLVLGGHLTWTEIQAMSESELADFAKAVHEYEQRQQRAPRLQPVPESPRTVAPPGNAPGEFDPAELASAPAQLETSTPATEQEQVTTPEQPAVEATANRVEFKSSNVRAAELGADGVLLVTFKDGAVYAYANFTSEQFEEWKKAASPGNWFHNNVRQKAERHPARKV